MGRRNAWTVCSQPGCPEYTQQGRCEEHRRKAERRRGSARQRGYGGQHETRFRPGVLARDPHCRCAGCPSCSTAGTRCERESKHADHWPLDRRQLVEQGLDPNDPDHGRGLCQPCHSHATTQHQPGGWNS